MLGFILGCILCGGLGLIIGGCFNSGQVADLQTEIYKLEDEKIALSQENKRLKNELNCK